MGLIEKAGRFVPVLGAALEVKNSLSPETIKRRATKIGAGVLLSSAAVTGIYAHSLNKPDEQHTVTMDGGVGTVKNINRNMIELHLIGFQTEVDEVRVEDRQGDRKALGIPLPDITHELVVSDRLIDSNLCITGGKKDMTETVVDGVKHVEYVLDPADISICSRESVNSLAISAEDGNWITNINDASDALSKLGKGGADHAGNAALDKANRQRSAMAQIARNLALQTVNTKCGPKVFELTKQDALNRIEDALGREDEVFTATFPDGLKDIAIEGKSEVDAFFDELSSLQQPGQKISYEVRSVGECKVSPEALKQGASTDVRSNQSDAAGER